MPMQALEVSDPQIIQTLNRCIEACVDGFQDAMQCEALNDEIPF